MPNASKGNGMGIGCHLSSRAVDFVDSVDSVYSTGDKKVEVDFVCRRDALSQLK